MPMAIQNIKEYNIIILFDYIWSILGGDIHEWREIVDRSIGVKIELRTRKFISTHNTYNSQLDNVVIYSRMCAEGDMWPH